MGGGEGIKNISTYALFHLSSVEFYRKGNGGDIMVEINRIWKGIPIPNDFGKNALL